MRIVVKVGTSTLAYPTGRLNIRHAEELVKVLSDLKNEGHEVILVSSGAIGMGVGKLSLPARPKDTTTKQACAAVGQCELMYTYDRLFSAYDHTVAQILLTGVDVEHTERRVNIQNTLTRLLELGALPIINENDSVATDEITSIGDNDTLAAIVACCCKADLLVLLSDIDGLYTANPHTHPDAALIPLVEEITPEVMALADGAGSALGTGGMATKLRAAYGFMMSHPGKKLLFMGQEFAQWNEWSEERALDWYLLDDPSHKEMQQFTKKCMKLYSSYPCLYATDYKPEGFAWINANDVDNSVYSFIRISPDGKKNLLFVLNFTPVARKQFRVGVPADCKYRLVLGSHEKTQAKQLTVDKGDCDGYSHSVLVDLPEYGIAVYEFTAKQLENKTRI